MANAAQTIAIIDYGSGNLRSAARAFERVIAENELAASVKVTADPGIVAAADRIVLPGVGAFAACMEGLGALPGMVAALEEAVLGQKRPFLGICVGMQLLAETGFEYGASPGLGWVPGQVRRIMPQDPGLKVPHMGWNEVAPLAPHPVLPVSGETDGHAYFVHSYHFEPANVDDLLATTDYGGPIAAAVARDNIIGVQFHPEKSQGYGLALIRHFLDWSPAP